MGIQNVVDTILSGRQLRVDVEECLREAFKRQQTNPHATVESWAIMLAADIAEAGMIDDLKE